MDTLFQAAYSTFGNITSLSDMNPGFTAMLRLPIFGVLSAVLDFTAAQIVPNNTYCTDDCLTNFTVGYNFDYRTWVSPDLDLDPFWDIPTNASINATAGGLIKWQQLSPDEFAANWTIPGGASLARFLYWTEGVDGQLLPASSYMLMPYALPKDSSKFRTIVWAHGTAGYARQCAPSNHRNLYYDWSAPYAYVQAGYAVIGPDYTGLGVSGPVGFQYLAGYSHAADVAFSLVAARTVAGDLLSDEWVVVGQSEGGGSAWNTAERLAMKGQEALLKAGTLIGAVALAPANRALELVGAWFEAGSDPNNNPVAGIAIYLLESFAKEYPDQINLQDYLTEEAYGRIPLADASCVYGGSYLYASNNPYDIFKDFSWVNGSVADDWRRRYNAEGNYTLAAPLLVVQGTEDVFVPAKQTFKNFQVTCSQAPDSQATLYIYEGLDHDVVTNMGQSAYLEWIRQRFEGQEVAKGCSKVTFTAAMPGYFNMWANVYVTNKL